jgi:mRNA-degrading endonuclease toxin of MazEF toxin-antitoxin module
MNNLNKEKLSKALGDSVMRVKMEEALKKYKERLEKQQMEKANEKKEKSIQS